ncbi:endonuclease/exonuclease/phosphatase family protein [Saccharothrix syringae]|uniref:Endonuclease n=1 Tax=Saccharothrix syringae TaxID=103733 RepID=A0A5Q0H9P5_SACSY|nr:endonuclease/exonuclease/phosphatase family protein [Saccharothrix syringae]QFZ22664.1 endonuclease [Saccharothrix syringae]
MTWNLWGRFGPWREREKAIIDTLRVVDPDVLALQEVWTSADGTSQLEVIAEALGMHSAGSAHPLGDTGLGQGNAVLSRWPISGWQTVDLTPDPTDPRLAVVADVETPQGTVPVVSTHLSWRPDEGGARLRQVRAIREHLAARPAGVLPPVVMGDLNAEPTSDEVRALTGLKADEPPGPVFMDCWEQARGGEHGYTWDHTNPYAACTPWPRRRLDYVLIALPDLGLVHQKRMGWFEVDSCELAGVSAVRGTVPSDHYAVVTRLRVLPDRPH